MTLFPDFLDQIAARLSELESSAIERRETHLSVVFLSERHAFKLRKPVRFDFVDLSTRESRYRNSWNEVVLNRRLADDVYLDVIPITGSYEAPLVGTAGGDCLDWLVRMRRLDDRHTLQAHLDSGETVDPALYRTAIEQVCRFLRDARPVQFSPDLSHRMHAAIIDNLATISGFVAKGWLSQSDVDRLRSVLLQWVTLRRSVLERREREGRVRDGHGDLKAEHIYLCDPPRIVDCLEFSAALRCVDTLDEICFLTNDLERGNAGELVETLRAIYEDVLQDPAPEDLAAFYRAYRLSVRAKVVGLRFGGDDGKVPDESAADLVQAVNRAVEVMTLHHRPLLIVVRGMSGTGKSVLARTLRDQIGARWIASDVVRKEHFSDECGKFESSKAVYSPEARAAVYAEMLDRAETSLTAGVSVVLDATYQRQTEREHVAHLVDRLRCPLQWLECRCPPETALARIDHRRSTQHDASDADGDVLRSQQNSFAPPAVGEALLVVDTTLPTAEQVDQIVRHLAVV